jgi:GNAT superfamily N-acetyltransferase
MEPAARRATPEDVGAVTEILALAFREDPTWSWAFPDPDRRLDHLRQFWGLYVRSGMRNGWVWVTDDGSAASVWSPPGEAELSEEDEAKVAPLLRSLVGEHAGAVLELIERFEERHPSEPPHYYLGLLGTHPDHRGQGRGMGLLAANLAEIDSEGMPAYLESTNRANDRRYARLGFSLVGEFGPPGGEPTVGCMWREARRG